MKKNLVPPILRKAIEDGAFPGCVASYGSLNSNFTLEAQGFLEQEKKSEVTQNTIYDLASLTKVIATTGLAMVLHSEGRFETQQPVDTWIKEFQSEDKQSIELRHLLAHASGLPAWKKLWGSKKSREELIQVVIHTPLENPPATRTRYSDLGAILLGECLTQIGQTPLATLAWEKVFAPLDMRETYFRPPPREFFRVAPTEFDKPYRNKLIQGEVHDENAHALGGVAGHAGLFSTALDLSLFAQEILKSFRGQSPLIRKSTMELFSKRAGIIPRSSRALGWDTPSGRSSAGNLFSRTHSIGHTGFTGTSIWIDYDKEIFGILLTNRVHPTRANRKISQVRRDFYDAVYKSCV